ncbi:DEAD/DEAH box helicase family protein [Streptomyces sp. NPDC048825]|uniref:DEAD/DEAH box helicase family protein n=1 Tax=Streptomyces sp. NPDC048825 TaxID=3365592 RepID=UPI003721FBB8
MTVVVVPSSARPGKRPLFADQMQAAERLVRHLRGAGTRGLLVLATGTGKTLVSIRVADELGARLVLFDGTRQEADSALRTTALHLSVLRAMTEHGLRRVLVYFNLVSDARTFARELPHPLHLLRPTDPGGCPDVTPELFFAHGE